MANYLTKRKNGDLRIVDVVFRSGDASASAETPTATIRISRFNLRPLHESDRRVFSGGYALPKERHQTQHPKLLMSLSSVARADVIAFVPRSSESALNLVLHAEQVLFVRTWWELGTAIRNHAAATAIIDPSADSANNIPAAISVLQANPTVYFVGYFLPTAANLKAAFELSKHGLREVFVHPVAPRDWRLLRALRAGRARRLCGDALTQLETALNSLPSGLALALTDLFQRPHRYQTSTDIAREADVPDRVLYHHLARQGLPTPKTFLRVAKVIYAFTCLEKSPHAVSRVARELGYCDSRVLRRDLANLSRCAYGQPAERMNDALLAILQIPMCTEGAENTPELA